MNQVHSLVRVDGANASEHGSNPIAMQMITKAAAPSADWQVYAEAAALIAATVARPTEAPLIAQLDQTLVANPSARLVIARVDGNLVGCAYSKLTSDETHGWIGGLAVAPNYRGLGISKELVHAVVEDRAQIDRCSLPLLAYVRVYHGVNQPSLRAFIGAGFVATSIKRVPMKSLQNIAPHFEASAASDGTVGLLLMARTGPGISLSQLGQLGGIS